MKIYIFCPYKNKLKKYNKQIKGKNMESSKKYFGARIKEIREKRGLNQEQLAELVGWFSGIYRQSVSHRSNHDFP